jgi:NADH-quinone oxidoreductase subunit G
MPKIEIDGQSYEVAEGRTVLQAIDDLGLLMNGVEIPHYCWHPKLSIDGSCRLCQVEIEGVPKLQIACNTPVRDGMAIRTATERVASARRGVMELLLLNHPLDCPICDQAGECKLQDYAFEYGAPASRTQEPRRPAKKAVDLGPTIVLDQERCILCRRCVRFCREVTKTGELGVFERGDESLLDVFPGSRLDNAYSMNVADLCPVGALTTRDFRFKIRVWFTDDVESVCAGCATGCNVLASRASNRVYRFVPRRNDAVNETWMCDMGRLSYKRVAEGRLEEAALRRRPASYDDAVGHAGLALREALAAGGRVVGVASPQACNEDLFVLRELLEAAGAEPGVFAVPTGEGDALLLSEERAPNAEGARALGFAEAAPPKGRAAVALVLGHEFGPAAFAGVDTLVVLDTHASEASAAAAVALPARWHLETSGTFTSRARRVQRFLPVLEPRFEAYARGEILWRIGAAAGLAGFSGEYDVRAVSKRLAEKVPAFRGVSLATVGDQGLELSS